jgi:hypothetical protein
MIACMFTESPVTDSLLDAIRHVESSNGAHTVGDNGKAIGDYQLWTVYVDDVNRILKTKKYTYKDREDSKKSREMTRIYLNYYARHHKLTDLATISRLHNGGPNGHKNKATLAYAKKIQKHLNGEKQ